MHDLQSTAYGVLLKQSENNEDSFDFRTIDFHYEKMTHSFLAVDAVGRAHLLQSIS